MPKRVLITGTSTGFGRDTAERLARRGDHVFATMRDLGGRNAQHRKALEGLSAREGLRLRVLALDVTDQASVDNAIAEAVTEAGGLDVVINNVSADALRPIVAQIFNVPELAGLPRTEIAATRTI